MHQVPPKAHLTRTPRMEVTWQGAGEQLPCSVTAGFQPADCIPASDSCGQFQDSKNHPGSSLNTHLGEGPQLAASCPTSLAQPERPCLSSLHPHGEPKTKEDKTKQDYLNGRRYQLSHRKRVRPARMVLPAALNRSLENCDTSPL